MYDRIIIGAGVYGLYAALYCGKRDMKVLVLEKETSAFKRATYINQARVHMGYHYPRSISTAMKSAGYFDRFCSDYSFCINGTFEQIYATSAKFSWTNAKQFEKFCKDADIPCEKLNPSAYFKDGMCDGAFLTKEYTYDAKLLRDYFLSEIQKHPNVQIRYGVELDSILKEDSIFMLNTNQGSYSTSFLLNATYASVNQIIKYVGCDMFKIKYELCEIILCSVSEKLKQKGLTIMDGPFFSIMPFGKTGLHSLTSVTFTPHLVSYDELPKFSCQEESEKFCTKENLGNCNECKNKPESAFTYMANLARKYMQEDLQFKFVDSLFSVKPILKSTEIDDSRPTVIRILLEEPKFISVLSGKINTVYDLDEILI